MGVNAITGAGAIVDAAIANLVVKAFAKVAVGMST